MAFRVVLTSVTLLSVAALAQPSDPAGRPPGPPQEALQACSGKSDGASCAFSGRDGRQLGGTCRAGPQGEPPACMPAHPPPPPEVLQACSGLPEGTSSTVTHGDRTLSGTCRAGPTGEALACAPAGPPPLGH